MLGYVPKAENKIPAALMDQGIELVAEVSKVDLQLSGWGRVEVKLYQVLTERPKPSPALG